jgi:hypothetical protein
MATDLLSYQWWEVASSCGSCACASIAGVAAPCAALM